MKLVLDLQTRIGLEPSSCSHWVASSSCSWWWKDRPQCHLEGTRRCKPVPGTWNHSEEGQGAVLQGEPHGTSPLFDALSSENVTGK